MRIQRLTKETMQNLLKELLKRSPAMTNSWQSANDGTKYPKYTVQSDYDYQYRNHMRCHNKKVPQPMRD